MNVINNFSELMTKIKYEKYTVLIINFFKHTSCKAFNTSSSTDTKFKR